MHRLRPGAEAPRLRFETVAHGMFDLLEEVPPGGTYLFFLRGSHCKWTRFMVKELDDRIGDFALRGIRMAVVSGESRAAMDALRERMQIIRLPLGFGADVAAVARDWGLYLTENSREEGAPPLHWEPAQVWVRDDGTIGTIAVQSAPNMWADVTNTLRGIENTREKFPERGRG